MIAYNDLELARGRVERMKAWARATPPATIMRAPVDTAFLANHQGSKIHVGPIGARSTNHLNLTKAMG